MKQKNTKYSIEGLMKDLGSEDGMTRQRARHALIQTGEPAVDVLILAFKSENKVLHFEAAKALSQIGSLKTIDTFIKALGDEKFGIRWMAAEALIAIGTASIKPLLKALKDHSDSNWVFEGAHHVLHDLVERNSLVDEETKKILLPVLEAYNQFGIVGNVLIAVNEALCKLRVKGNFLIAPDKEDD